MKAELFIEKEEDSIILFKGQNDNWMEKQIVGKERSNIDIFIQNFVEL